MTLTERDILAANKRFTCPWCKGTGRAVQTIPCYSLHVTVHHHACCRACRGVGFITPARFAKIKAQETP